MAISCGAPICCVDILETNAKFMKDLLLTASAI